MTSIGLEKGFLIFNGCNHLKQRLILSTLSGKPIEIRDIRAFDDQNPGLRDYEISLIRLFDKVTNGTKVKLDKSGMAIVYQPGVLNGGTFHHECSVERGLGYYLDVLVALGPFCKHPLDVTLTGVTNSKESPSVDHIKSAALSTLKRFLIVDDGLELTINKRGMMPLGGGEISFKCPIRKNLKAIQCIKQGMVKRIRGTAYCSKVSPMLANRTVDKAKGVMLKFLPDIYIHTDQNKGKRSGKSPGYGIHLTAETNDGTFFSSEVVCNLVQDNENPSIPEDMGNDVGLKLLDEIYRGGCVDSTFQWLVALYMALGQKDVSKFLIGPLSQYTIYFLQHLREFFGVTFKLENGSGDADNADGTEVDDDEMSGSNKVMLTCLGIGYSNYSKRVN